MSFHGMLYNKPGLLLARLNRRLCRRPKNDLQRKLRVRKLEERDYLLSVIRELIAEEGS